MTIYRLITKDDMNQKREVGFFRTKEKAIKKIEELKECQKGYTPLKYEIERITVK